MRKDSGEAREQVRERGGAKDKAPSRGPSQASPKVTSGGGNAFSDALKGKFGR
jgi:uncharacterized protein